MDNLRAQKLAKAREIVLSNAFLQMSLEKRRQIIKGMLAKGLHPGDLPLVLAPRNNDNNNLNNFTVSNSVADNRRITTVVPDVNKPIIAGLTTMGRDPLFNIIKYLDHRSINALCSTDTALHNFCYDNKFNIWNYLVARDLQIPLTLIPPGLTSKGESRAKNYYLKRTEGGTAYVSGVIGLAWEEHEANPNNLYELSEYPSEVRIKEKSFDAKTFNFDKPEPKPKIVKIVAGRQYKLLLDAKGIAYIISNSSDEDYNKIQTDDNLVMLFANALKHFTVFDVVTGEQILGEFSLPIIDVSCYNDRLQLVDTEGNVFDIFKHTPVPSLRFNNTYRLNLSDNKVLVKHPALKALNLPDNVQIVKSAIGKDHSIFLLSDGRIVVAGDNTFGQLGLGESRERTVHGDPITNHILTILPHIGNIVQIAAAYHHTLLLSADGIVYSFGNGSDKVLGHGNEDNIFVPTPIQWFIDRQLKITYISTAIYSSGFIDEEGNVYMCGGGLFGKLGQSEIRGPMTEDHEFPSLVKMYSYTSETVELPVNKLGNNLKAIQISCGKFHTAIVITTGKLYTFGLNAQGQLGLGERFNRRFGSTNHDIYPNCYTPHEVKTIYNSYTNKSTKVEDVSWVSCGENTTFFVS